VPTVTAAQAQSKIKILEKLPELEPPEADETETFRFVLPFSASTNHSHKHLSSFPDCDKISPPVLQLSGTSFSYTPGVPILQNIDIDVGLDSRIAVVGANGAGK
jgi:ATP-binding cassette, subfamily F, member 3